MGMFDKFNMENTIREGIDISNMEFQPLSKFTGMTVKVDGFYFNDKGDYGRQVVLVGNGCLINMPSRAVKVFEEIKANAKMLKAVLEGHLAITGIEEKELSPDAETGEARVTTIYKLIEV